MSLFSVTFCRQIISNSVFLSATQEKKKRTTTSLVCCSSFKRDVKHAETQKGRIPRRVISAKNSRELAVPPAFLKHAPSFTFSLAISVFVPGFFCFFFLFVLRKCLLPLCCHTALNSKRETRRRNLQLMAVRRKSTDYVDWKRRSKFTPNLKQPRKANNLKGAFVSQPPWSLPVAAQHEQKAQVFKSTRPLNNFEAAALLWSDEGITGFTSGPVNTLLFSHELHVTWPRTRTKRTLIPLLGWNNYLNAPLPWAGRSPGRPLVSH